ncbi:relaxase/mobilization nuclease domain-containing protein [Paracoccus versutus]|uniref:relaxase/mobilization nuclease domain-containing protein n=1 Tax=Paracoccus versutus TaxID=34007 RepID=UPI000B24FC28
MSHDDREFRIRPGRPRSTPAPRSGSFVNQVLRAARKAGPVRKSGSAGESSSSGRSVRTGHSTFGRGRAGFGRSRLFSPQRRVVVKARVVRHRGRSFRSAPMTAHLAYLQREGVRRDDSGGLMSHARSDDADDPAFAEHCQDDRHHFRFIVSPEDAADMADLKRFTRDFMTQVEKDLGTDLDWIAVDHWNTDNPHVHVILRGRADDGKDLVISRDYIREGLRGRAQDLITPRNWGRAMTTRSAATWCVRSRPNAGPRSTASWSGMPRAATSSTSPRIRTGSPTPMRTSRSPGCASSRPSASPSSSAPANGC